MGINQPLFVAQHICLGPIDHEKDAEIEARWTHDLGYLRMLSTAPAIPKTASQIKKRYEAIEKEQDGRDDRYYFTIRMRPDDRLIGFGQIPWVDWSNRTASIRLGIGDPQDRQKGYGSEVLALLLRFGFAELNLFRMAVSIPEYNLPGLRLFCKFGFVEEVRLRQALKRDGKRWDLLELGLLAEEWENMHRASAVDMSVNKEREP